jgi:uncharacterized protein (DUF2235 family)
MASTTDNLVETDLQATQDLLTEASREPAFESIKDGSSGCNCKGKKGRNLVVCIDGTANQFNVKNTNVVELYSRLLKDKTQLTFYNSGIGTYAKPSWTSWSYIKQIIGHKIDLAIAWRFEGILLDAYRWLSQMYKPGDRIFLFGFSRGAYQVRALSAMIELVGLIRKGNEAQIPFAFELYASCTEKTYKQAKDVHKPNMGYSTWEEMLAEENQKDVTIMAFRFKETFSNDVNVHFVGAWDTVSSVGIVRGDEGLPLTGDGMKHVCYFRHALALDERRVKFLPEFAYGGVALGPANFKNKIEPSGKSIGSSPTHTKEVWFTGTHSDIGGGSTENPTLNANRPSLRWMKQESIIAGIYEAPSRHKYSPSKNLGSVNESLTPLWWILEILPIKRLTYQDQKKTTWWPHIGRRLILIPEDQNRDNTTWLPHWGRHRRIAEGQLIHSTVKRIGQAEKIKDRLPQSWNGEANYELDPFDRASDLLIELESKIPEATQAFTEPLREHVSAILEELHNITSSTEGRLSLRELKGSAQRLLDILRALTVTEHSMPQEFQHEVAISVASILLNFAKDLLDQCPVYELPEILQTRWSGINDSDSKIITRFIQTFCTGM